MSRVHISASFHEKNSNDEENEVLHISLIRAHSMGYDFKSTECKWAIFDDAITVKMNNNGKFYFFPMTSVLYYFIESFEEEENDGRKEML